MAALPDPGEVWQLAIEVCHVPAGEPSTRRADAPPSVRSDQADATEAGDLSGAALGLAICQAYAHALGGGMHIDPDPAGGLRSRAWFRCRRDSAQRPGQPAAERAPSAVAGAQTALQPIAPASVLIVDDNTMIRSLLQRILAQAGYAVSTVSNGAQAVAAVAREAFDVVLMDVSMPVMDGMAATRSIRTIPRGAGLRPLLIIGISAHAMAGDTEACLASGMDHYLTKPIPRHALLRALANALDGDPVGRHEAAHGR